ncbi:hypothetical protein [endosymbiont of Tevnia jerichonana]|uniref:Uncharacterized protein n=1 Tax=endosymbiont of Tevnia jerichonana (vent Tica) TaxID=1049564 RepID=G2FCS1_9GAMM|nr:hypothetical protein [endosymbiont of Tevnia jerichonana]EGW55301.1 hypothetical protein TevJSym_ad00350 [endosymbiont of Tevnia jerichonana (vent Tica)]
MKHIKKVLSYSIAGSIGLSVIASLNGCSDQGAPPPAALAHRLAPNRGKTPLW